MQLGVDLLEDLVHVSEDVMRVDSLGQLQLQLSNLTNFPIVIKRSLQNQIASFTYIFICLLTNLPVAHNISPLKVH